MSGALKLSWPVRTRAELQLRTHCVASHFAGRGVDSPSHRNSDSTWSRPAVDRGTGARVAYLDNLKRFLIAGVIVRHAATAYGAIGARFYVEPSLCPLTKAVFSVGEKAGWLRAMDRVEGALWGATGFPEGGERFRRVPRLARR